MTKILHDALENVKANPTINTDVLNYHLQK